jgi:hypothetical protein
VIEARGGTRCSGVWRSYHPRLALAMLLGLAWGGCVGLQALLCPRQKIQLGRLIPALPRAEYSPRHSLVRRDRKKDATP